MPRLIITDAARAAIQAAALPHERLAEDTAVHLPNGNWYIPLQQSTIDRLLSKKLEGETISETIIRICSLATAGLQ